MVGSMWASLAGFFLLPVVAWIFSSNHRLVNWRVVLGGMGLQLAFGAAIFLLPGGRDAFLAINDGVNWLLMPAAAGAEFVFGPLAVGPGGKGSIGFILAFQGLPLIIFFSALMAMLYYFGIMQRVIHAFSWIFSRAMRTSGAESLYAAGSIFAGVELSTGVKPYLLGMTRSELCVVLTAGMATVSSNILGFYVSMLSAKLPQIAGHLVSASILSAPAALLMAKLVMPEEAKPATLGESVKLEVEREDNLFSAIITGAQSGLNLVLGIVALLIAVFGLMTLANALVGLAVPGWSLELMLGKIFLPFAYLLGVPAQDAAAVAGLLGERLIKTEVVAYGDLAGLAGSIEPRSAVIAAYALCGFAHLPSVAIFVGGLAALVPARKSELASLAWRALLAATLACLMTACVAGFYYSFGDFQAVMAQPAK